MNPAGIKIQIEVLYSCHECGLNKVPVLVPARESEGVIEWMNATVRVLARDHSQRSPRCETKALNDIMIPISGADRVGGPVAN